MQTAMDEQLCALAKKQGSPLPEGYAERVKQTCAQLESTSKMSGGWHRMGVGIAAAIAIFVAAPNVSAEAARTLGSIPVIGQLVQVVTFRHHVYNTNAQQVDIRIPQIQQAGEAGEQINAAVQAEADRLLRAFEAEYGRTDVHAGLDIQYQVAMDNAKWFTLRVYLVQTVAGGAQRVQYYHINKNSGKVVTLSNLFPWKGDYIRVLSDEVRRQMEERNATDPNAAYFPEELEQIDPEQSFYWNEDGKLVLVFDEYTVAAGSMGISEFVIAQEILQSLVQ